MKVTRINQRPEISVVVPLFDEEDNLVELHRRVVENLEKLGCSFELILVNDGSSDRTGPLLDELHAKDARVVAIHLSRNFGQQPAYCAGIDQARGQAVVLMDGDLQDPPEVLARFVEEWKNGHEVVYAVRVQRKESLLKRTCYALFYRILRSMSDLKMPLDSGDFCLLDRKVVKELRRLPEQNRFLRGLRTFVGYRQIGVTYERPAREAGETKYDLKRLYRLAMDGLVGFSSMPLSMITWLGSFALAAAVLMTGWWLGKTLLGDTPPGAGTIIVVLWCSATQLLSLGVMGEYLRRIFVETKGRPTYIIRTVRRRKKVGLMIPDLELTQKAPAA